MRKYLLAIIFIFIVLGSLSFSIYNFKINQKLKQQLRERLEKEMIKQQQDEALREFNRISQKFDESLRQEEKLSKQQAALEESRRKIEIMQMLIYDQNTQKTFNMYQDFSNNMRDIQRKYQQQQKKRCYTTCSPSVFNGDGTTSGSNCVTECY